jgi:sterol desaturase/sphingolipid hydroxylase (fatty acid hydroxylase superfamily)
MDVFALDTLQLARQILAWVGLICFMILEQALPFAPREELAWKHYLRNVAIAATNVVIVALVWRGLLLAAAAWADGAGWGLLPWLGHQAGLTRPWRIAFAVPAFDALSYGMHVLYHRVPVLWRLHRVHHTDLDFDVTTASRFHAGEILLSTVAQTGAAVVLGAPPEGVLIFQMLLLLQAQAQHSNMALPDAVDRVMRTALVTPNLHRIHHSTVVAETNSNYSTIFSVWDRIGRTLRLRPQAEIVIGLEEYRVREELGIVNLLAMPFRGACGPTKQADNR